MMKKTYAIEHISKLGNVVVRAGCGEFEGGGDAESLPLASALPEDVAEPAPLLLAPADA